MAVRVNALAVSNSPIVVSVVIEVGYPIVQVVVQLYVRLPFLMRTCVARRSVIYVSGTVVRWLAR